MDSSKGSGNLPTQMGAQVGRLAAQKLDGPLYQASDGPPRRQAHAVRHNLPQIPTMSHYPRLAVSKASVKEYPPIDGFSNIVPMDEIMKEKGDASGSQGSDPPTIDVSALPGQDRPPASMPTPPSEGSASDCTGLNSQGSPILNGAQSTGSSPSNSPPTPIKLRIRRSSVQKGGALTSSLSSSIMESSIDTDVTDTPKTTAVKETSAADAGQIKRSKKSHSKQKRKKVSPDGSDAEGSTYSDQAKSSKSGLPDRDKTQKWLVGDLVWSKVGGHPWWPCMVSFDPILGIYTKLNVPAQRRSYHTYHVQFFGDVPEHAWVTESSTLLFEGKAVFDKYTQEVIASASGSSRAKLAAKFKVTARRHAAWSVAVSAAEEALPLSRTERRAQYTFVYADSPEKVAHGKEPGAAQDLSDDVFSVKKVSQPINGLKKPKQKHTKRKLQALYSGQVTEGERPSKRQRTKSPKGDRAPGCRIDTPIGLPNQSATQFMVFCQKRKSSVREDHPDYNDDKVEECLLQQWNELDKDQQSKFIPMGLDVQNLSEMYLKKTEADAGIKRSQRVPRPSKKKLEAEEDSNMYKFAKKPKSPAGDVPLSAESLADLEDVINSVAQGAGDVTLPSDDETDLVYLEDPWKQERKSKIQNVEESSDSGESKTSMDSASSKAGDSLERAVQRSIICEDGEEYELEIFKLSATGPQKKENICQVCEQPGELLICEGPCGGSFHMSCLGLKVAPAGAFKCDECTVGKHTCFVCEKPGIDVKKCSVTLCGKFYHEECINVHLTRWEGKSFYCPLHTCSSCAAIDPKNPKCTRGRLYRCVRCPTAFHIGDYCIAAGSIHLAGFHIVCGKHFQPIKTHRHHAHVNVSWCFVCSKGGTLLCCETCPAAFHAECLKIDCPQGAWYCRDCSSGKKPLYGDIVWVKLGNYRWWPAEVCHPKNVPLNIQEKPHQVGEFPVRFFGSHDYFWTHQARVFLFQEGDKGTTDYTTLKGLAKMFKKAVREATAAFKVFRAAKKNREQQENEKTDRKPAPYRHIKCNFPIGNVTINKVDLAHIPRCECKPADENPCGSGSECLNRMLMYECHPAVCPAGDKCNNQRFQKRLYPESVPVKTPGRGWGLQALVDIKKGQFVNEYVGDLIDEEECKRRINKAHDDNITNFYMLTLDNKRTIDAGPKGNLSRFMNHSCQPNLETQKWNVNGDVRVGLFAIEDIPAGSELTFNYNLDCLGNEKTVCQCGAPNCSGFLGVRPKTAAATATEKKVKEAKKRKKSKKKAHEDECYRCGEGGELVMCDKLKCPKAYHLGCLSLSKPPHGRWDCPWHHCDICGKNATHLCTECPNSFCAAHAESNIFDIGDNRLCCSDHEDIMNAIMSSKQLGTCSTDSETGTNTECSGNETETGTHTECEGTEEGEIIETKKRRSRRSKSKVKTEDESVSATTSASSSSAPSPAMESSGEGESGNGSTNDDSGAAAEPIVTRDEPTGNVSPVESESASANASAAESDTASTTSKSIGKPKGRGRSRGSTDSRSSLAETVKPPAAAKRGRKGVPKRTRRKGNSKDQPEASEIPAGGDQTEQKPADFVPLFDDDDDFGDLVIDIPSF